MDGRVRYDLRTTSWSANPPKVQYHHPPLVETPSFPVCHVVNHRLGRELMTFFNTCTRLTPRVSRMREDYFVLIPFPCTSSACYPHGSHQDWHQDRRLPPRPRFQEEGCKREDALRQSPQYPHAIERIFPTSRRCQRQSPTRGKAQQPGAHNAPCCCRIRMVFPSTPPRWRLSTSRRRISMIHSASRCSLRALSSPVSTLRHATADPHAGLNPLLARTEKIPQRDSC